jgi:hypothetical protein
MANLINVKIPMDIMGRSTKNKAKPHLRFNVRKFFFKSTLKCVALTILLLSVYLNNIMIYLEISPYINPLSI